MPTLTDNAEKMAIVDRLVKEGAIDFAEALKLLEKDVQFTLVERPYDPFSPTIPYTQPFFPNLPVTCSDVRLSGNEATTFTALHGN